MRLGCIERDVFLSTPASLGDIVLFIIDEAPQELGITKLMKLVFLADVEYAQLFGVRLCAVDWTWYDHGPFSKHVYGAVEALDEQGHVHDVFLNDRRLIQPSRTASPPRETSLTSPQRYALRLSLIHI